MHHRDTGAVMREKKTDQSLDYRQIIIKPVVLKEDDTEILLILFSFSSLQVKSRYRLWRSPLASRSKGSLKEISSSVNKL